MSYLTPIFAINKDCRDLSKVPSSLTVVDRCTDCCNGFTITINTAPSKYTRIVEPTDLLEDIKLFDIMSDACVRTGYQLLTLIYAETKDICILLYNPKTKCFQNAIVFMPQGCVKDRWLNDECVDIIYEGVYSLYFYIWLYGSKLRVMINSQGVVLSTDDINSWEIAEEAKNVKLAGKILDPKLLISIYNFQDMVQLYCNHSISNIIRFDSAIVATNSISPLKSYKLDA